MEVRKMPKGEKTLKDKFREMVFKHFPDSKGNLYLNVGCGNDNIKEPNWINIDADINLEDCIHATLGEYVLPFRDCAFDAILCSHVLEHIPNLVYAKSELCRVLKPGGTLVIIVPNYLSLDAWGDDTHCRAFSIHSFVQDFWPGFDGEKGVLQIVTVRDLLNNDLTWLYAALVKE